MTPEEERLHRDALAELNRRPFLTFTLVFAADALKALKPLAIIAGIIAGAWAGNALMSVILGP